MNQEQIQTVYQLTSFLLRYPKEEVRSVLPELKEEILDLDQNQVQDHLLRFIDVVQEIPGEDWIDHYIQLFDFGRTTNLYVTYLKLGEQRERGLELLKLKNFYSKAGFEVIDKELPDYLPLMLEFSAHTWEEGIELLTTYEKAIREIRETLVKAQSFYTFLLDALLITMEEAGIYQTA